MEKKYKWGVVILWLVIGFLLIKLVSFPKHGTVVEMPIPTVALKSIQKYSNEYFSFCYPDDYLVRSEVNNLWLTGKSVASESIVTTSRVFKDNIEEETGVKLRNVRKNDYLKRTINVAGVGALYFEKKDLTERSIFILRKNIMTTFSMTANFGDDRMVNKLNKMLECWEWK